MGLNPRELHKQAWIAQEAGDFTKALSLEFQAMIAYQQMGDKQGFAEIQAMMFLTYRHLYQKTGEKEYLLLAKHAAIVSVELAELSRDKTALAIPLMNLARSQEMLENYEEASESYEDAYKYITSYPPKSHDKEAVKLDMAIHMLTAQYRIGKKDVVKGVLEKLEKLKIATGATEYERNVWLSGGYMRLAEVTNKDNTEDSKMFLLKAKEIIDHDPNLELRRIQWEELAKKLFGTIKVFQSEKAKYNHDV